MTESLPKVIDPDRFEVTFGSSNQAEIFETIAKHVRDTGDTVETMMLFTGSESFMATIGFYTDDISRLPLVSLRL